MTSRPTIPRVCGVGANAFPRVRLALLVGAVAALGGCAGPPSAGAPDRQATASGVQAATPSTPSVAASRPTNASVAGQASTFSTQLATYTSVGFEALPGWGKDDVSQSWPAFLGSCKVLSNRGAQWRDVCDRARSVPSTDSAAIKRFFESEFSAYQIRDDDRKPDGVVTGYFEPEIEGRRGYAPPYIYPVYGQPQDMLFADARKLPAGSGVVAARVEGSNVVVQTGLSTRDMGAPGLYALDLSAITRDTLDRKVRLRIEGKRLLPYFTREEIETKGAPNAKVIAFVSSATALYEMQIQGSGRIRMANDEVVRVAYAEQNGQPFRPTLAPSSRKGAVKTRGGLIELDLGNDDDDTGSGPGVIRTRGFTLARPTASGAVMVPGRKMASAVTGSGITDPSYVFFKESDAGASGSSGPIGAFGVPLSAGRSIAVDPRSTPLGFPVFVSTREPGTGQPMQRLTIAQDTGGAIRGAVRADYFFGNGQRAATQARSMKERGQLWILLPRGLPVAATTAKTRTRGGPVGADLPQCLVPVEGQCVDD